MAAEQIQVDLPHFARTAQLGPFYLGMPRSEIESTLCRKFEYVLVDDLHILRCGSVAFHCRGNEPLHVLNVFVQHAADDRKIAVELGTLRPGLSVKGACAVVKALGIKHGDVHVHSADSRPFAKSVQLDSGVTMSFHRTGWFGRWSLGIVGVRATRT